MLGCKVEMIDLKLKQMKISVIASIRDAFVFGRKHGCDGRITELLGVAEGIDTFFKGFEGVVTAVQDMM